MVEPDGLVRLQALEDLVHIATEDPYFAAGPGRGRTLTSLKAEAKPLARATPKAIDDRTAVQVCIRRLFIN
jgi:hypothetical protein